jgi:hypothetical protein
MLRPIQNADYDAAEIDVGMTEDGTAGTLVIVARPRGITISLPRAALERLRDRISRELADSVPPDGREIPT